jgi:hypothetical protein
LAVEAEVLRVDEAAVDVVLLAAEVLVDAAGEVEETVAEEVAAVGVEAAAEVRQGECCDVSYGESVVACYLALILLQHEHPTPNHTDFTFTILFPSTVAVAVV